MNAQPIGWWTCCVDLCGGQFAPADGMNFPNNWNKCVQHQSSSSYTDANPTRSDNLPRRGDKINNSDESTLSTLLPDPKVLHPSRGGARGQVLHHGSALPSPARDKQPCVLVSQTVGELLQPMDQKGGLACHRCSQTVGQRTRGEGGVVKLETGDEACRW